jgi:uncharacterized delta-60 repeat protein
MKALVSAGAAIITCCSLLIPLSHAQPGSLDITFNPGAGVAGGPNGWIVTSIALRNDGKIMIGGSFTSVNGQPRNSVARLNSDGSLDNGFLTGQGPDFVMSAVEVDPNGGVYIGGDFDYYNGIARPYLAKLRDDGSLDVTWSPVAFALPVTFIKRQLDGRFLVLGNNGSTGANRSKLVRLNTDGTLDLAFNPAANITDGIISAVGIQSDGKVIIGGSFTTNSPLARQYVARVNADGALDPNFDAGYVGGGAIVGGGVNALAIQPDGMIIIGGSFTSINGYSRLGIARLNTNGVVDTTFVPGPVPGSPVFGVTLLPEGRGLLASGSILLDSNGNYKATFAASVIDAVTLQPDGKILIGGTFSQVAGTNIQGIARLTGFNTNSLGLQFLSINPYAGMFLTGTVSNSYRVEWTTNLNTPSLWTPLFNLMLQTGPQFVLDPDPTTGRQRFYRAVALP